MTTRFLVTRGWTRQAEGQRDEVQCVMWPVSEKYIIDI